MDDILELLNMSSWSDIGGLRNQLEFNSAATPPELGPPASSAQVCKTEQAISHSALESNGSGSGFCQDGRNLSNEELFLGSHIQRQYASPTGPFISSQALGVNCNVMPNQEPSAVPLLQSLHMAAECSMLSTPSNMLPPSGPIGLNFDPSSWRQQPVIGDLQSFGKPELFLNSHPAGNYLYGARFRDAPVSLRMSRDPARVYGAHSGGQLGQSRPPVQSLQPNSGSRYRTQPGGPQPSQINSAGAPRPRVRARRGQATDPHSIAERQRRERIAERMKELQILVPNAHKTDKAIMLDEIIEYVKFLRLQVKILDFSHNHGTPLPPEYVNTLGQSNNTTSEGVANIERQVARLMDENEKMDTALQFLQSKGFCLVPIPMAAALSSVHQPIFSTDKLETSSSLVTERPAGSASKLLLPGTSGVKLGNNAHSREGTN